MNKSFEISNIAELKVGMFDLGDGLFSDCAPKKEEVRSVVVAVLPDEGRAIGFCPVQSVLPWCYTALGVVTMPITSGKEATACITKMAAVRQVTMPALEFCLNYQGVGVTRGEAFLPTRMELQQAYLSESAIFKSMRLLGERWVEHTLFSSTIDNDYFVWVQGFKNRYSQRAYQCRTFGVCPAVDIKLA